MNPPGFALEASAIPLSYNVVITESNIGVSMLILGQVDVTPDLTEGLPGGDDFPATALMTGSSNTFPTGASSATADVGLPGLDDEITISTDLYEVLLAYQHFRRPSA